MVNDDGHRLVELRRDGAVHLDDIVHGARQRAILDDRHDVSHRSFADTQRHLVRALGDDDRCRIAIALRFERDRDPAPIVVAKGADQMALRIRERAVAHNVPIIEDRPLARAMYDIVEVDRAIPTQFYKAVAVIIHHLSRKGVVAPARRR